MHDVRASLLKEGAENPKARYVLYWMQMFKRVRYNHALNFAIRTANERALPLVVYEGLRYDYPWANDRIHTFILEGVAEKKQEFERQGIRYVFYLQRNADDPGDTVATLAREAAVLVTDEFPCFIIPQHNRRISEVVSIPVYTVDSNGIIPISCFDREEYAAYTIRPKIRRLLPQHLDPPGTEVARHRSPQLQLNCPESFVEGAGIPRLVASCTVDHTVAPSPLYHGGTLNARTRLNHFAEKILPHYEETRNKPSIDGTSRLSPYIHFGFISAHEVVEAVNQSDAPAASKEAFLEELIVRRELSFNFTRFNPRYDSLDSVPPWAQKTMREHLADPRPALLSEHQLEHGETYDEMWNACQRELLYTGVMHNYVRMLWGKLVIGWTRSYEEAFAILEHLNNKYALDGRDPNSYAGVLWCFGKHDRAWGPVRPVFGTLRYMTSQSMAKKIDAKRYIEWTNSFENTRTHAH